MRGATTALKIYFKFIVPNETGKLVLLVGQVTRNAAKTANQSVCFPKSLCKSVGFALCTLSKALCSQNQFAYFAGDRSHALLCWLDKLYVTLMLNARSANSA